MDADQEIIKQAIFLAKERAHDNKHWANRDELDALLRAGAEVMNNGPDGRGNYICEVWYERFKFIHVGTAPIHI